MEVCIETHRQQLENIQSSLPDAEAESQQFDRNLPALTESLLEKLQKQLRQEQSNQKWAAFPILTSIDRPTVNAECNSCQANQGLADNLIAELKVIWEYADMIQSNASNKWDHDMRRTAGFYQLHEQALIKELNLASANPSAPAPAGCTQSKTRGLNKSQQIEEKAKDKLERLKAFPLSSHKWVCGIDLTRADILNMVEASTNVSTAHSGYVKSLPDGSLSGDMSDISIPPNHDDQSVSPLAPDNTNVPETFVESMCAIPVFIRKPSLSRPRVLFSDADSADITHMGPTSFDAFKAAWKTADLDTESPDDSHTSPSPPTTSFNATKAAWKAADIDTKSADDSRVGPLPQTTLFDATKAAWKSADIDTESADDSHVPFTLFDATKAAWKTADIDIKLADDSHVSPPSHTSFDATKAAWRTAESADDSHVSPPLHTSFDATKAAWRTANSDIESADDARVGLPLGTSFEATKAVWRSHHTNASADGLDISLAGSSDYSRSAEDDQHDHQVGAFDRVAAAYRTRSITASAGAEDGYSGAKDPHSSDQSSSGSLCVPEAELRLTPPLMTHITLTFSMSHGCRTLMALALLKTCVGIMTRIRVMRDILFDILGLLKTFHQSCELID
ncbi:hypothetical protein JOM56_014539 [Amanita muscaria]